ncbi:hypothetical protein GCM10027589_06530 [Actinocorallia lasiicapitis]
MDEVAELFLAADRAEKDQVTRAGTALQRIASTGRARIGAVADTYYVLAGPTPVLVHNCTRTQID